MTDSFHQLLYAIYEFFPVWGAWLCAILFLVLVERLSIPPSPWDRHLLGFVRGLRGFWLDRFFALITWSGSLYLLAPVTVLIVAFLIKQERTDDARLLVLSLTTVALCSRLAKLWFARPRPNFFPVLSDMPTDPSYPSAHTAQIVAFVLALWWISKPEKIGLNYFVLLAMAVMLASAVAASRIYLQVHYPSDVIAGILLAVLWSWGLLHMLQILGFSVR